VQLLSRNPLPMNSNAVKVLRIDSFYRNRKSFLLGTTSPDDFGPYDKFHRSRASGFWVRPWLAGTWRGLYESPKGPVAAGRAFKPERPSTRTFTS
jgi:hypothetical protein